MIMTIIISIILLFLGIGVLVLIHICIVGGVGRGDIGNTGDNNNTNNNNTANRGSLASTSMSRDDIERLPSFDFRERVKGSSPVDCSVCLENFKLGDKCRLLPICKHSFHAHCVDMWLLKTPFCPICRTNNGAWRIDSMSGEESSLFSESGYLNEINMGQSGHFGEAGLGPGDGQTTNSGLLSEIVVELEESRTMENGNVSENMNGMNLEQSGYLNENNLGQCGHSGEAGLGSGDSQKRNSGHLSEIVVESGENQTVENGNVSENLKKISVEDGHFSEVRVELSDSQTSDTSHLSDCELGENQINDNSNDTILVK